MKIHSPFRAIQFALVFGLVVGLALSGQSALAASCNAKASSLAASMGGNVLSVSASGDKCIIKLLIKSGNGPPKRKTFVVSK